MKWGWIIVGPQTDCISALLSLPDKTLHFDELSESETENLNSLLMEFEDTVRKAMDKQAPIKTMRVPVSDEKPWYDQALRDQKIIMRR